MSYYQQHGIEEPFLLAAAWIEGGKGVGEPQELRTAVLSGGDQHPQRAGMAVGRQLHSRAHAVRFGGHSGHYQARRHRSFLPSSLLCADLNSLFGFLLSSVE